MLNIIKSLAILNKVTELTSMIFHLLPFTDTRPLSLTSYRFLNLYTLLNKTAGLLLQITELLCYPHHS